MVTIGFNPVTYSQLEEAGSVNVTVSILDGTLGRNVVVTVSTSGGTATGEFYTHACTHHKQQMKPTFLLLRVH